MRKVTELHLGFQFHKVRLKEWYDTNWYIGNIRFQFHKVRLKVI